MSSIAPGGHGDAGAEVLVGVPAEVDELEAELARVVDALEDAHPCGDDLGADAVAGDHCDSLAFHERGGLYGGPLVASC